MSPDHTIVTPEAVVLEIDTAGLGSRLVAFVVDGLIQAVAMVLFVLSVSALGGFGSNMAGLLVGGVVVLTPLLYGAVSEGLWDGRTPGKRVEHLRVVQTHGQPITWKHALIRNLFRLLDVWLLVGAFFIALTKRSQRLGDLAAGTMVIREPAGPAPQPLALRPDVLRDALADRLDISGIGTREYAMLRDFLRRRFELNDAGRRSVGRQLADMVRARVPLSPGEAVPDELLIEAAVVSVQSRDAPAAGEGRNLSGV